MIPDDSLGVVYAILFCLWAKFFCYLVNISGTSMYRKQHLSSIPENNETEDEVRSTKWVPKKKHEVLKAKYKCLKKLFQIYDASVIGILPESYDQGENYTVPEEGSRREKGHSRRKKRSYRTKTDACAGTSELSSGDVSVRSEEKGSIASTASTVIRDLKVQCSCSTQMMTEDCPQKSEARLDRPSSLATDHYTERNPTLDYQQTRAINPIPYFMFNEQRKPTRLQSFIQRLFGIRREKMKVGFGLDSHAYAASDNNITYNYCEKRRRRGLRFRRLKKLKTHSDMALRDASSPAILNYLQTIQKNCLMDRTPRQCPMLGCKMMFYGIINYNDHLNLCHFTGRKFACHYCHEGFEVEYEKFTHENEHLGVNKLKSNVRNVSSSSTRQSQKSSNTQTEPDLKSDVPEDKLKKIVSFFDKLVDTDQMLTELNKNRYSESNLHTTQHSKTESDSTTESEAMTRSDKRTASCGNLMQRKDKSKISNQSDMTSKSPYSSVKCHLCGEDFDYRRQLYLHVDQEHGHREKPSKFHSCAGIANCRERRDGMAKFEAGKINIQNLHDVGRRSSTVVTPDNSSLASRQRSEVTLSCDPSTNIIYYESLETVKKPSVVNNFVDKMRSGITSYRWEPGTKIIRV